MPTQFQNHVEQWKNCEKCSLCKTRKNVVLYRGKIPCDVLFVGEAPGLSENVLGQPFVGPAGTLLNQMITQALPKDSIIRIGFTNLIACIPFEEDTGEKTKAPPLPSIKACADRLKQITKIASPQVKVLVGKLARKHAADSETEFIEIPHPAFILRIQDEFDKQQKIERVILILRDLFFRLT